MDCSAGGNVRSAARQEVVKRDQRRRQAQRGEELALIAQREEDALQV